MNWFGLFFVMGLFLAIPIMGLICYILERYDRDKDIRELLKYQHHIEKLKNS